MPSNTNLLRLASLLVAIIATAFYLYPDDEPHAVSPPVSSMTPSPEADTPPAVSQGPDIGSSDGSTESEFPMDAAEALIHSPEFLEFEDDQAFRERVRDFFAEDNLTPTSSRQAQARSLDGEIVEAQADERVSAAEALMLRIALIQRTEPDEEAKQSRITGLIKQYRQDAEKNLTTPSDDPEFKEYKQREQAIVKEVMAMDTIPNGMDRDAYLRLRLQQAREDLLND